MCLIGPLRTDVNSQINSSAPNTPKIDLESNQLKKEKKIVFKIIIYSYLLLRLWSMVTRDSPFKALRVQTLPFTLVFWAEKAAMATRFFDLCVFGLKESDTYDVLCTNPVNRAAFYRRKRSYTPYRLMWFLTRRKLKSFSSCCRDSRLENTFSVELVIDSICVFCYWKEIIRPRSKSRRTHQFCGT